MQSPSYPTGVLDSAAELLRGLPRRRHAVDDARRSVREWALRHPRARAELVVAPHPASPIVDYDLIMEHPGGGTVTITVQPEDGVPWLVDQSTHWAANRVVTVDGAGVTVPEALLALRSALARRPSAHRELIDHCLLRDLAAEDEAPVSAQEAQRAADEFRRSRGLLTREATLAWLADSGLTEGEFGDHLAEYARISRLRRRIEAERGPALLAAHPERFEQVTAVWVRCDDEATAGRLAEMLPVLPDGRFELTSADVATGELPGPLRGGAAGDRIGPVPHEGRWLAGLIRDRRPADGPEAARAAGRAAFEEWLAERRAAASITWHWL